LLDFVKSVDTVYKEAKLLRASVANSEKIDRAFERAINIVFFTIFICVTLSQIGYDPLALFLSLSSIILAFAFMIGTASSKMFEGFLLILIRRPVSETVFFTTCPVAFVSDRLEFCEWVVSSILETVYTQVI
jgi:small-conductance mechanosensitive channel